MRFRDPRRWLPVWGFCCSRSAGASRVCWLESYVAALCAVIPISLMVLLLSAEERFLRQELSGYTAYAERVRSRLIPGIW